MAVASYSFDEVKVMPLARKVLVRGKPVALTPRAFDLLLALIERRGRSVSKDEIFDAVWPGQAIEESNILVHVSLLRKALGASVLETVPGRGYRFAPFVVVEEEAPAAERGPGPGTNLPRASEELVGRTDDLEAIAGLLRESRLVTIAGPGGVGKSRVATDAARRRVRELPHGAWRVDFAALASGEEASAAIARAAGVALNGDDPAAALVAGMRPCEMLLVLDNCERLVDAVAAIADRLLAACPGVRIVATSQEPLRLTGERVHPLPPLALPPEGTPEADARQCPALRLLQRRVRALKPSYQLTGANVARAVALCRRLDGLPLAIEMAAAWIPAIGLPALLARVDERLDLLQNPDPEAPPRQRSLRAALDWSHSLLTPAERRALRRLAELPDRFGLDEARQAMAADALDEWQALETLTALCDKSLVMIDAGEATRYRLPETGRLYVRAA